MCRLSAAWFVLALFVACQVTSAGTMPLLETYDDDPIGNAAPVTQGETWTELHDDDWSVEPDGAGHDYRGSLSVASGVVWNHARPGEIPGMLGADFTACVDFEIQELNAETTDGSMSIGLNCLHTPFPVSSYRAMYYPVATSGSADRHERLVLMDTGNFTSMVISAGSLPAVTDGSLTYTLSVTGRYATPGNPDSTLTLDAVLSNGTSAVVATLVDPAPISHTGRVGFTIAGSAWDNVAGSMKVDHDNLSVQAAGPDVKRLIWGIKSDGDDKDPPSGPASMPPARLFYFDDSGANPAQDVGVVSLRSQQNIDVDALAVTPAGWLYAFELFHGTEPSSPVNASRLVRLDPATAVATPIGGTHEREMRGAGMTIEGTLWALDAMNDEVVKVNPATGGVGGALALTLEGNPYDLSDRCDLAFDADGTAWVVDRAEVVIGGSPFMVPAFYTVDLDTGEMTKMGVDDYTGPEPPDGNPILQYVGCAFSPNAATDPTKLFSLDISSDEDVFYNDVDGGFARLGAGPTSILMTYFDSGRGDLGAAAIPEPMTMVLLGLGALALIRRRR